MVVFSVMGLNMSKRRRRWLSWMVVSGLLSLSLGLGCGSAANLNAKDCCENSSMCHHGGDASKDPQKCCQEGKQSKPVLNAHLSDSNLAKKIFDFVLLDTSSFADWFDSVVLKDREIPPPRIFKLPQQDLYKLTSALLI